MKIRKYLIVLVFIAIVNTVFAYEMTVVSQPEANVGDTFPVNITINGTDMMGAEFNLTYDSSVLNAISVNDSDVNSSCESGVGGDGWGGSIEGNGWIYYAYACFNGTNKTQSGNITFATVTFEALSPGTSYLNLTDPSSISDPNGTTYPGLIVRNGTVNVLGGGVPAPQNLTASLAANRQDVVLNWSFVSDAESYTVYYSSNLSQILDLNVSDIGGDVTNVTGITTLNWTDTNAGADKVRYYSVSAVKGSAENLSEEIVGKLTYELFGSVSINAHNHENMISLPFNTTYYAEEFLQGIGSPAESITKLVRDDGNSYTFVKHVKGLDDGNNFSMDIGEGYIVYVNETVNYTIVGDVDVSPNFTYNLFGSVSINAHNHENMISLPFNTTYYAEEFLQGIGSPAESITKLVRDDGNSYTFVKHVKGLDDGNNFSMDIGEGYIVYVNETVNHTIS